MVTFEGLPGAKSIVKGLHDIEVGKLSVDSLLIAIAASRLRELGVSIHGEGDLPASPELLLYEELLRANVSDAYYEYNARLRRLDSFISALESRKRRHRV